MKRNEAEQLLSRIINRSQAEETFVVFRSVNATTIQLAASALIPPLHIGEQTAQINIRNGKRYAVSNLHTFDDASIDRCFIHLEEMSQLLPEADTLVPFPEARIVLESPLFHQSDDEIKQEWRYSATESLLDALRETSLSASGSLVTSDSALALASSGGLFFYQPSSLLQCDLRVFTADGMQTSSGRMYRNTIESFNMADFAREVCERCLRWKDPVEIKPERLTTIFTADAVADFLLPMMQQFSMRAIQENRSFLRRMDATPFLGSKMFTHEVNLRSNPFDTELPSLPFTVEGAEVKAVSWVKNGVIENIAEDRYDTVGTEREVLPLPTNLIMDGGTNSLNDLIRKTKRGILVHGFSSLQMIDPQNCLLTGSTRDGTFLIENGKITKAVQNLIIRETPVYLLKEVLEMSAPEIVSASGAYFPMRLPALLVKDVMFTQVSGII